MEGRPAGTAAQPRSEPEATRWWTRRRIRIGFAALLVVAALIGGAWWETHPAVYPDYSGDVAILNKVGQPALFAVTYPTVRDRPGEVHVLATAAHVTSAPPGSKLNVEVVYCAHGHVGVGRGSLAKSCGWYRSAAGSTQQLGRGAEGQLLLVVSCNRPGKVVVDGMTVTYRDGIRFGRQHFDVRAIARFTRTGYHAP